MPSLALSLARALSVPSQPTLQGSRDAREWVVLNKWAARLRRIGRGDVVAVRCPSDHKVILVKRMVALEGDIVR